MYGVVMRDPGGGLMQFVNGYFPELGAEEVYWHWAKGNEGAAASADFFRAIGFAGDLAAIEREYLNTIAINETFYGFAEPLKKDYVLALLSNDLSEWSGFLRKKFMLDDIFDYSIVSGDVKLRKPDPVIYRYALDLIGVPARSCVFVDDRRRNLNPAKALGMDAVLYNSRNVEYDGKIVNDFNELAGLLARLG